MPVILADGDYGGYSTAPRSRGSCRPCCAPTPRLRREPGAAAAPRWRAGLERANVAVSLIFCVEYSAIGAHWEPLQMAHPVLREVPLDES